MAFAQKMMGVPSDLVSFSNQTKLKKAKRHEKIRVKFFIGYLSMHKYSDVDSKTVMFKYLKDPLTYRKLDLLRAVSWEIRLKWVMSCRSEWKVRSSWAQS